MKIIILATSPFTEIGKELDIPKETDVLIGIHEHEDGRKTARIIESRIADASVEVIQT